MRNKIIDLNVIIEHLNLHYFVISETKLDEYFPNAQFNLNKHQVKAGRDKDKNEGGLFEFVKQGFFC